MKTLLALPVVLVLSTAAFAAAPAKVCHDAKGHKARCPVPASAPRAPGAENPQPTAAMLAPVMRCHSMKTGKMVPCTDPNAQPVPVN